MTKKSAQTRPHAQDATNVGRKTSRDAVASPAGQSGVTRTSERIIKATSVKRQRAMKALANR